MTILFYSICIFIFIAIVYELSFWKITQFQYNNFKYEKKEKQKLTSTIFTLYQEEHESNEIINNNLIKNIIAKNCITKYDIIECGKLLPNNNNLKETIKFSTIGELKEIIEYLQNDTIILSRIKCKDSLSFSSLLINNTRISSIFDLKETIKNIPDNSTIINEIIFERFVEIKFLKIKFRKRFIASNTYQISFLKPINEINNNYVILIVSTNSDKFYSKN